MINIKKNSINRLTIDIDQYEYYLVKFTNTYTCDIVTAIFANLKYNCSYPVFNIEEVCSEDVDVLLGKINLDYIGFWDAEIYGNIDDSNLDTGLATLLESEDTRVYLNGCNICSSC